MPCGHVSSPSCWSLFGPGEEGLRAMFRKKSLLARSRSVRAQPTSETQCLLNASSESLATAPASQASVSFAAFYLDEEDEEVPMPPAVPPAPVRQESRFLSLPQEIRDEIYGHVFRSTRLAMGRRITCTTVVPSSESAASGISSSSSSSSSSSRHHQPHMNVTRIRPARHSLALFRVCRQVHAELHADDAWLGQVLFDFADMATMLDVLGGTSSAHSPLAQAGRRGRVRQVRVREGGLARTTPHRGTCGFLLGGLMRLLPDLRLDRLTVLPAPACRLHGAACCYGAGTGGGNGRVASHDVLAELLRGGRGWRELCYVHHDVAMLAADRRRRRPGPGSHRALEAMMVSMGFWDDDVDVHDDGFAFLDRPDRPDRVPSPPGHTTPPSSSVLAAYAASREFRLPAWQAMLAARDDNAAAEPDGHDAPPPTSVDVYGVRAGQPLHAIKTLADVYRTRLRGDDFIVVARRQDRGQPAGSSSSSGSTDVAAYPFADGDPRTLGYGTTWEELRSFLFSWDYVPETRCRHDRYVHRDEYTVGPLRHPDGSRGVHK